MIEEKIDKNNKKNETIIETHRNYRKTSLCCLINDNNDIDAVAADDNDDDDDENEINKNNQDIKRKKSLSNSKSIRRRSSVCQRKTNDEQIKIKQIKHRTILNRFQNAFYLFKSSSYFNLFLFFIISILTNSIYFNLFFNSTNKLNYELNTRKLTDESKESLLNKNRPSLKSLISWSTPSSHYIQQTNRLNTNLKSFDHVKFPSLDDSHYASNQNDETDQNIHTLLSNYINLDKLDNHHFKEKNEKIQESKMALRLALNMEKAGKFNKAAKIYKYALSLDPTNTDALTSYGEYLELYKKDILKAEHFYSKVVHIEPENNKAHLNLKRALPLVAQKDRQMLDKVDRLLKIFYEIPSTSSALKRAKKEAYFMHIYHSNAIEGNTLNLQQTRHIVENRMAVNGKSIHEHNEVLGLDAAMRFLNETLLYRPMGHFNIQDILDLHKRVLGFCDPIESGKFRKHQVYVGHFTPPSPEYVEHLMDEFIEWLNSNQLLTEAHPIQIAAMAHYKFVYIHPFYDGNGRTGRLLMNLILMKFGYPPIIIKKEDRLEYYEYLEMANQGDIKPFIRFIAKCTQTTLIEYIRICNNSYSLSVDETSKMMRHDLMLNNIDYLFSKFDNDDNDVESHFNNDFSDSDDNDKIILD